MPYKVGKTTFQNKTDYQAYLLQSVLDQLEYLSQLNIDETQTEVVLSVMLDVKKVIKTIDSPLKKIRKSP